MSATWRIHVIAPDAAKATEFKERFYKAAYADAGAKVTFEVPLHSEKKADEIIAAAKALDYKAEKEKVEDPLDAIDGSVDFW